MWNHFVVHGVGGMGAGGFAGRAARRLAQPPGYDVWTFGLVVQTSSMDGVPRGALPPLPGRTHFAQRVSHGRAGKAGLPWAKGFWPLPGPWGLAVS
jgi:hypothetical protein